MLYYGDRRSTVSSGSVRTSQKTLRPGMLHAQLFLQLKHILAMN